MKAIELKEDGSGGIIEFESSNEIFDYFGGIFDIVHCKENLEHPFVMLVDDCGYDKGLPANYRGSYFYGSGAHGHLILGPVLIMKEVPDPEEGDYTLAGLSDIEIEKLSFENELFMEIS